MLQEINFFIQKATQQTYLIYYIYQLYGYTLHSKFKLTIIMIKLSLWKHIFEKQALAKLRFLWPNYHSVQCQGGMWAVVVQYWFCCCVH